jgi:hypothetical protein
MKRMIVFIVAVLPVLGDTQFSTKRMTRDDVPVGKGQCDIRLQIDQEAEVRVRGDLVSIRTFSGREARDDGSECMNLSQGGIYRGSTSRFETAAEKSFSCHPQIDETDMRLW